MISIIRENRFALPWAMALMMALGAWADETVCQVFFRNPRDARAWSRHFDPAEALTWRWAEGAASATLATSNLVTGAVAVSQPVARGETLDGSCALGVASGALVDVTLKQMDGTGTILETRNVRLMVGSPSDPVATSTSAREFRFVTEARIFSWSDIWAGVATAGATLATTRGTTAIGSWELPGAGGYGVLRPQVELGGVHGPVQAQLAFDDAVEAWLAELMLGGLGTMMIFR